MFNSVTRESHRSSVWKVSDFENIKFRLLIMYKHKYKKKLLDFMP